MPQGLTFTRARALIVSGAYPADPERQVNGIFQRLRLFAEAVSAESAQLEMLFFADPSVNLSPVRVGQVAASLAAEWGIDATVKVVPFRKLPIATSLLDYYIAPALSITRQLPFARYLGPEQVDAVRAALAARPDWIFTHRLQALLPCLATGAALPPIFFDLDDVEHRFLVRSLFARKTWLGDKFRILHLPVLMHAERRALRSAATAFVCSHRDRDYLQRLYRLDNIVVVPNPARLKPITTHMDDGRQILFVGAYGYAPNADAAERLVTDVFPRVRASIPQARLVIVGEKPEAIAAYRRAPQGVTFTGFVDDLDAIYASTALVCCPIVFGAGTRMKIVEAAGYGKAIVATRMAAEGLEFVDGREIVLKDSPAEMAAECVRLLEDRARREALGAAARARVEISYEREAIVAKIRLQIRTTIDHHHAS